MTCQVMFTWQGMANARSRRGSARDGEGVQRESAGPTRQRGSKQPDHSEGVHTPVIVARWENRGVADVFSRRAQTITGVPTSR